MVWNKIGNAPSQGAPRAPFLPEGKFERLEVLRVSQVASKKPHQAGKEFFAVDLKCHGGEHDGKTFASVADLSRGEMTLTDCKAFVEAVLPGVDVTAVLMNRIVGEEQPATGMFVAAKAEIRITLAGKNFTKVFWSPVAD